MNTRIDYKNNLASFARELDASLESADRASAAGYAWQKLHGSTRTGEPVFLSYEPEAVRLLENALDTGNDDPGLLHHLAVAYHARAWELEETEPVTALEFWQKALDFWRKLKNRARFWNDLISRGEALGAGFEKKTVTEIRQNLMRYLSEIHVRFIQYYDEAGDRPGVKRHVELIKRARLSPAERKRFEGLVYAAMTSTIPRIAARGQYHDALFMLEDFLQIYPQFPPALQFYLEIAAQWVEQLSPKDQWEDIRNLDERVQPRRDALNMHQNLERYPLAGIALDTVSLALGKKFNARARSVRTRNSWDLQEDYAVACRAVALLENVGGPELGFAYWLRGSNCFWRSLEETSSRDITRLMKEAETDIARARESLPPHQVIDDMLENIRNAF